jgi:hypothetical protein
LSVSDTEIEPANAPPSGVIAGVPTVVFFELIVVLDAEKLVDRLVAVEVLLVLTVVVEVDTVPVVDVVVVVTGLKAWG